MKYYHVCFLRKTCLAEIPAKGKSEKQAREEAFKSLHKYDRDYDEVEIIEIDKEEYEEDMELNKEDYPSKEY